MRRKGVESESTFDDCPWDPYPSIERRLGSQHALDRMNITHRLIEHQHPRLKPHYIAVLIIGLHLPLVVLCDALADEILTIKIRIIRIDIYLLFFL